MVNHMSETTDKRSTQQIKDDPIHSSGCPLSARGDQESCLGCFSLFLFSTVLLGVFCFPFFQLYCTREWQGLRKAVFRDVSGHQDSKLTLEKAKHSLGIFSEASRKAAV